MEKKMEHGSRFTDLIVTFSFSSGNSLKITVQGYKRFKCHDRWQKTRYKCRVKHSTQGLAPCDIEYFPCFDITGFMSH